MPGLNKFNVALRSSGQLAAATLLASGPTYVPIPWAIHEGCKVCLQHLPRIHEADVADVFAAFDIDRDNIISQKDMASIMKQDNEATTSKFVRCEMMWEIERARNSNMLKTS